MQALFWDLCDQQAALDPCKNQCLKDSPKSIGGYCQIFKRYSSKCGMLCCRTIRSIAIVCHRCARLKNWMFDQYHPSKICSLLGGISLNSFKYCMSSTKYYRTIVLHSAPSASAHLSLLDYMNHLQCLNTGAHSIWWRTERDMIEPIVSLVVILFKLTIV